LQTRKFFEPAKKNINQNIDFKTPNVITVTVSTVLHSL